MKIWKYHAISMYTAGCVARVLVEVIYYMEGQKFSAPASCFFYGAQRSQRYSHRSWFLQGSRRVYPSNSRCLQQYSSLAGRRWSRPSKWSDLGPLQLIACSEHFGTRRSVFCHDSNTVSALISVPWVKVPAPHPFGVYVRTDAQAAIPPENDASTNSLSFRCLNVCRMAGRAPDWDTLPFHSHMSLVGIYHDDYSWCHACRLVSWWCQWCHYITSSSVLLSKRSDSGSASKLSRPKDDWLTCN